MVRVVSAKEAPAIVQGPNNWSVAERGLNQCDRKVGAVKIVEADHVRSAFLQKKVELPAPFSVSNAFE